MYSIEMITKDQTEINYEKCKPPPYPLMLPTFMSFDEINALADIQEKSMKERSAISDEIEKFGDEIGESLARFEHGLNADGSTKYKYCGDLLPKNMRRRSERSKVPRNPGQSFVG